jgi:hypothetical protein
MACIGTNLSFTLTLLKKFIARDAKQHSVPLLRKGTKNNFINYNCVHGDHRTLLAASSFISKEINSTLRFWRFTPQVFLFHMDLFFLQHEKREHHNIQKNEAASLGDEVMFI